MCNFWTCVLTSDGKVHYSMKTSSHEDLIKRLKLDGGEPDGKPFSAEAIKQRQFVRIEVTPKETLLIASKKPEDWALKVDEEATLPEWFTANRKAHESAIWKAWAKAMRATLWKLNIEKLPKLVAEIKAIPYHSMNSPPSPEWKMHYGKTWQAARYAVWDAARYAAWDAARDAAEAAARYAVWDAARYAARYAAWDAARDAARYAAWNAAGYAARDATLWIMFHILPSETLARFDPAGKHQAHANARMEVWKKGYGLLCDIDGVLYCYGKGHIAEGGKTKGG